MNHFSIQNISFHVLFFALLIFGCAAASAQEATAFQRCDELAGHMNDQQYLSSKSASYLSLQENVSEALLTCQEAANSGQARYIYQLGRAKLLAGDHESGIEDYRTASDLGHANATFFLGIFHWNGTYDLAQDSAKAIDYYWRAYAEGSLAAPFYLGQISLYGWAGEVDHDEAFRMFREAENRGNTEVCFELGLMYQNGWSVAQDLQRAIGYYDYCIFIHQTRLSQSHAQAGAAAFDLASKVVKEPEEIKDAYRRSVRAYLEAIRRAEINEARQRATGALRSLAKMQRATGNAIVRDSGNNPDLLLHWDVQTLDQIVEWAKTLETLTANSSALTDEELQILRDMVAKGEQLSFAFKELEEILDATGGQNIADCFHRELEVYDGVVELHLENDCDYAVDIKARASFFRRHQQDSPLQTDTQETDLASGGWDTIYFEESYFTYDDLRVMVRSKICPTRLGFDYVFWSRNSNDCHGDTPMKNDKVRKAYHSLETTWNQADKLLNQ